MTDYALLIHKSEAHFANLSPSEQGAIFGAYGSFTQDFLAKGGKPGAALLPTGTATCLRVRNGKTLLTDGPFSETKEQLAGFYRLSTNNMEEAYSWASKIPDAAGGSIEIRALPTFEGAPSYPAIGKKSDAATQEYLLLIYEDESVWARASEAQRNEMFGKYFAVSAEMRKSGAFVDGAALASVTDAKTVRVREGKRVVSDGPFAETKEQLGGYYQIWAKDLDEAIAFAKKIPAAETGTVEIRPVMDTSQFM